MTDEEISEEIKLRNLKRAAPGFPEEYEFEYNNAKYYCVLDRVMLKEVMLKNGVGEFEIPEFVIGIFWGHDYLPYCSPARSPFHSCRSIKVTNKSQIENMVELFMYCNELEELDLSGFDASKVYDMSGMFRGCTHLVDLRLDNFDTSQVRDMSIMFSECSALVNLDLSAFDTSNVKDMQGMFSGCTALTALDLSSFTAPRLETAYGMFEDCTELRSLDLSNLDTAKSMFKTRVNGMFSGCDNLRELRADKRITKEFRKSVNKKN